MTKEDKQWLKENEPWNYESFYGDPVTGQTNSDDGGCLTVILLFVVVVLGFLVVSAFLI